METIYSIKLEADAPKLPLYRRGGRFLQTGGAVDLGTYFNAFSLGKWLRYTTVEALGLQLDFHGRARVALYGLRDGQEQVITEEDAEDGWTWQADGDRLRAIGLASDILGVRLVAESRFDLLGGSWRGSFETSRDIHVGAVICTYRRETYLRHNLDLLEGYCKGHPWLSVMVIDNGQTLGERHDGWLDILPNRNYGGSGGFTRGLIEQMAAGVNDYFLLMDDDIEIETAALDRLIALCRHVRDERQMQMIGGAMLRMDAPTIQHENTAWWGSIFLHPVGRGFDLGRTALLCANEQEHHEQNRYAGWWFCCIPRAIVVAQGYPLPVFLKGDDVEYAIRSGRDIMTMNGIGVWHVAFDDKRNPAINYFNDRNRLILEAYLPDGGWWRTFMTIFVRLANRIRRCDRASFLLYEKALRDYAGGLDALTEQGSDEIFQQVRTYESSHGILTALLTIIAWSVRICWNDAVLRERYQAFRKKKLRDAKFWCQFLGIGDRS